MARVMSFQLNAIANRAAGKGYENEDNYSNIKFQFMGIENIHVMRNSQQKMLEGKMIVVSSDDSPSLIFFFSFSNAQLTLQNDKHILNIRQT